MKTLGNILWFILGGWIAGTVWVLMGVLCYVTIIGIPFGTACFRISSFAYFPFGKELVDARNVGEERIAMTGLANFLWVVLFGLWNSIFFILAGITMCCGVVTIPFGFAYFKLAAAGFAPLGKRIVSTDMARVIRERKAGRELDQRTGRGGDHRAAWSDTRTATGRGGASALAFRQAEWEQVAPREAVLGAEAEWELPEYPGKEEAPEPEEEEAEDETENGMFLRKVRLGRKLDVAMKGVLSTAERRQLGKIQDYYLAGVDAQQTGEKEVARTLYRRAEDALAAWRKDKRCHQNVALPCGQTMRFHWCPAGEFTMGSPIMEEGRYNDEVQHKVMLTRGFWMAETAVTQGQWMALMSGETVADLALKGLQDDTLYTMNGKTMTMRDWWGGVALDSEPMKRCGNLDDDVPVYHVSWREAKEFCRRLTRKGRNEGWLPSGYSFRLPTEAEWEYACRAGTVAALPNGLNIRILGDNNAPDLDEIAWYGGNSSVRFEGRGVNTDNWPDKQYPGGRAFVRRVGLKAANKWGLYDVIGNVWEWCEDEYASYPTETVTDYCKSNSSTALGVRRIVRGGSWLSSARGCRSAVRNWRPAGYRRDGVGFRPVCSTEL